MATVVLHVLPFGGHGWQQLRGLVTRVSGGGPGGFGPPGLPGVIWSAGGTGQGELGKQHGNVVIKAVAGVGADLVQQLVDGGLQAGPA